MFQCVTKYLCTQRRLRPASIKKVSEYVQEILQSQTVDKPMPMQGRATQKSRDTSKTNQAKQQALSSPSRRLQARMDTK